MPKRADPLSEKMGSPENCIFRCRNRHLLTSLLFVLLVSNLNQVRFMAAGRGIPNLVEAAQEGIEGKKVVRIVRTQIRSRPPRCERSCNGCRPCEVVQVPIVPEAQIHKRKFSASRATPTIAYSGGDDTTIYKPLLWMCKCRDSIFNP